MSRQTKRFSQRPKALLCDFHRIFDWYVHGLPVQQCPPWSKYMAITVPQRWVNNRAYMNQDMVFVPFTFTSVYISESCFFREIRESNLAGTAMTKCLVQGM